MRSTGISLASQDIRWGATSPCRQRRQTTVSGALLSQQGAIFPTRRGRAWSGWSLIQSDPQPHCEADRCSCSTVDATVPFHPSKPSVFTTPRLTRRKCGGTIPATPCRLSLRMMQLRGSCRNWEGQHDPRLQKGRTVFGRCRSIGKPPPEPPLSSKFTAITASYLSRSAHRQAGTRP